MSRGPRHACLVALINKPISRNKSVPSHRHVSHAVRWNHLLHYKWLHSPEHLLLTALSQGLVSPWSRIMTAHFTPHSPVTLSQAASPVLFACVTLSSVVKKPCDCWVHGSRELRVRSPAAPCKTHTDLLSWEWIHQQQQKWGGITSEIMPKDTLQSQRKADACRGSWRQIGFN